MGHGIAEKYHLHILTGVGQGILRCSEKHQYGVEKQQSHHGEHYSHDDVQRHVVAQYPLRYGVVFLSEFHRQQRRRAYADGGSEGGAEIHKRESHCKSGDCHCPHTLTYEHAVHHVVE